MQQNEIEIFYPTSQMVWRKWLQENHHSKQAVWLVFHSKKSGLETLTWSDSVDVALCFGWIDSKKIKIDEKTAHQFFSKRKPKGTWSKINKNKVEKLIAQGLMTDAGLACIETAKQNGSWTILDQAEALIIPDDLEKEFQKRNNAKEYFLSLSRSDKRNILQWLILAKRQETREKRINEIVELADKKQKPKQFSGQRNGT